MTIHMDAPESKLASDGDIANDLSISFSSLLPVGSDRVASFLECAAFAMGGREADLARVMGVSRATFSGWKSRGAIPAQHRRWFVERFPALVLSTGKPAPGDDFRHAGLPAALWLLKATDFNPFGLKNVPMGELIERLCSSFGGLVRLGHFIQLQLPLTGLNNDRDLEQRAAAVLGNVAKQVAAERLPIAI